MLVLDWHCDIAQSDCFTHSEMLMNDIKGMASPTPPLIGYFNIILTSHHSSCLHLSSMSQSEPHIMFTYAYTHTYTYYVYVLCTSLCVVTVCSASIYSLCTMFVYLVALQPFVVRLCTWLHCVCWQRTCCELDEDRLMSISVCIFKLHCIDLS